MEQRYPPDGLVRVAPLQDREDVPWLYMGKVAAECSATTVWCRFHGEVSRLQTPRVTQVAATRVVLRRGSWERSEGTALFWLGQCPQCRAIYWADEARLAAAGL
ncbi:MAG: hypothetical protein ACYCW6_15735 [Candidatus Xenobia bacterium]